MKILLMTAHPDYADIMAGGTIARSTDEGHDVHSVIFTRGDKGHEDPTMTAEVVATLREAEQRAAAAILSVSHVTFLAIGLETADDLIADLEAALKPITSAGAARTPIEPRSVPSGLLDVVSDVVEQRVAPSIIARGGQLLSACLARSTAPCPPDDP
jgi:GlcNAc-PI de-N-acetylase